MIHGSRYFLHITENRLFIINALPMNIPEFCSRAACKLVRPIIILIVPAVFRRSSDDSQTPVGNRKVRGQPCNTVIICVLAFISIEIACRRILNAQLPDIQIRCAYVLIRCLRIVIVYCIVVCSISGNVDQAVCIFHSTSRRILLLHIQRIGRIRAPITIHNKLVLVFPVS